MLQTILFLTILNSIGFGYCIFRELKETYVLCKKEVYDAMAIYGEDDNYFIIFDEEKYLIPQEVINNTPVRQVLDKHGFTVNNVLV